MPLEVNNLETGKVQEEPKQEQASLEVKPDDLDQARFKLVRSWQQKIRNAKRVFADDFKRMKSDMEFAYGLQWNDQKQLQDQRYVANLTQRMVNQKVSTLYARDPKAIARRRKRLDFSIWDGHVESVMQAAVAVHMNPMDVASRALLLDYTQGKDWQKMIDKVGKTMEIVYQYQCDSQDIPFKLEMKQLVRRVITCGVGFVCLDFQREHEDYNVESTGPDNSQYDRLKRIQAIAEKLKDKDIMADSQQVEELRLLVESIQAGVEAGEQLAIKERLEFDFSPADSIIVDTNCRSLKGFIGAQWLVREFDRDLDEVNTFFELKGDKKIKCGSEEGMAKEYNSEGAEVDKAGDKDKESPKPKKVRLWKLYNKQTRQQCYMVDGWKDYVQEPEDICPRITQVFPVFGVTFNDCESGPSTKASIYPPSDVTLIRSAQKEYNRVRDTLRAHRKANAPLYCVGSGTLTERDIDKIKNAEPNEVVQLEGVPNGGDVSKAISAMPKIGIDPIIYDAKPINDDIDQTVGMQEANLGPAKPHVTATVGNIAEQSRVVQSSSNVDDLDDLLTCLAKAGGETMLREFSVETVTRIANRGAVWPTDPQQREDFIDELFLDIIAASSGRPNKALEVSNAQQLGPLLMQAGANPQALIREFVKRLDDQLEPEDFFPMPGALPMLPTNQPQGQTSPKNAPPNTGPARPPGATAPVAV